MDYQEHRQEALGFLRDIDEGRAVGRSLLFCEILWGAATHSVRAYARWRGWRVGKSQRLRELVDLITEDCGDAFLREGFNKALSLHSNFYNGFMTDEQIAQDGQTTRDFAERVLALLPTDDAPAAGG